MLAISYQIRVVLLLSFPSRESYCQNQYRQSPFFLALDEERRERDEIARVVLLFSLGFLLLLVLLVLFHVLVTRKTLR